MPAPRARRIAVALMFVCLPVLGCNPEQTPVARVGSTVITMAEFERVARDNALNFPGDPRMARQQLLDSMVRRALLLAYARKQGLDTTAALQVKRSQIMERLSAEALAQQLASPRVRVSDAEVAHFYDLRRTSCDVALIFNPKHDMIEHAQAALAAGEPFAQVADRYSFTGALPPGGAIGEMLYGNMMSPLDAEMLTLHPGRIGGPYATANGWFLMRVNSRRENTALAPFAQQRAPLTEMIRQRKVRTSLSSGLQSLRHAWDVRLEPDAAAVLFEALMPFRQGLADAAGPPPGERTRVLARWRGGEYTLGSAWIDLGRDDREKPPYENTAGLESWIENMCVRHVALLEAKTRRLGDEPEVQRRWKAEWDNALLEAAYNRVVADVPMPTGDDARIMWEQQRATTPNANMPAFDQLPPQQQQRVYQMAVEAVRDRRLKDATDQLVAALKPEVFADRVAKGPWPPPAPIDVGGW